MMRKTFSFIVILVVLLSFSSAYNAQEIDGKVNSFAPNITVSDNDSTFTLSKERGKYVVLNFWSSDNPESRIRNISAYNATEKTNNKIVFVAVNYDRSKALFNEILQVDGIDKRTQFFDEGGTDSEVYKQFRLDKGLNCYLINRDGKIIAVNPDLEKLTELTRQ